MLLKPILLLLLLLLCHHPQAVMKELLSCPEVLVLRPTWKQVVTPEDITNTLAHLQQHLDLSKVYDASKVRVSERGSLLHAGDHGHVGHLWGHVGHAYRHVRPCMS
jgi:hypothetical protein